MDNSTFCFNVSNADNVAEASKAFYRGKNKYTAIKVSTNCQQIENDLAGKNFDLSKILNLGDFDNTEIQAISDSIQIYND